MASEGRLIALQPDRLAMGKLALDGAGSELAARRFAQTREQRDLGEPFDSNHVNVTFVPDTALSAE